MMDHIIWIISYVEVFRFFSFLQFSQFIVVLITVFSYMIYDKHESPALINKLFNIKSFSLPVELSAKIYYEPGLTFVLD